MSHFDAQKLLRLKHAFVSILLMLHSFVNFCTLHGSVSLDVDHTGLLFDHTGLLFDPRTGKDTGSWLALSVLEKFCLMFGVLYPGTIDLWTGEGSAKDTIFVLWKC